VETVENLVVGFSSCTVVTSFDNSCEEGCRANSGLDQKDQTMDEEFLPPGAG
jgi:hypothetical protein